MLELKSKLAGFYQLEVRKSNGSVKTLTPWFPNLITNGGLDRCAAVTTDYLNRCLVGSGNTAPANTDTQLATFVAYTASYTSIATSPSASPYYASIIRTYTFGEGVAAGNLSEVGIGWASTNTNLFSRALIVDSEGSPITITVLSDEYLIVRYELRRYVPEIDTSSTITISSVSYTFTGRASSCTSASYWLAYWNADGTFGTYLYDGSIGAITTVPSGSVSYFSNGVTYTYVAGNYYLDYTYTIPASIGNFATGVSAINFILSVGWSFQFGISPVIPKTADDILELVMRVSWGRV